MSWLLFYFTLQLSYIPDDTIMLPGSQYERIEDAIGMSLMPVFILFDYVYIDTEANFKMIPLEDTFYPLYMESIFDIYVKYNMISIGYKHYCKHPFIAWRNIIAEEQDFNRACDEFYIRFSTKEQ